MNKNSFASLILILFFTIATQAQEKKVAPTSTELFTEIEQMDQLVFDAFNNQDMDAFKVLFTEDLEWFQDNGGLLSYETVFRNFDTMFHKEYKLTRTLAKGSMEVHPVKDYGAIETGTHQFRHIENGKEEIGTFKFLMIWKKTDGLWKISRVVSYDH
jgi:ketosteroid isomerase-like protein